MMYQNELSALAKSNRIRTRHLYDESLADFSSNDYLGLAENKKLFERAVTQVSMYKSHAPKASMVVNGYHPIHQTFEEFVARTNGFEAAMVCGSGFLANFSLIEALPRKKDLLILDEEYHASGMVASKTIDAQVLLFTHNDANHLEHLINTHTHNRIIIAVEGIYSMSGDLLNREIFEVANRYNALLIVDEAHSVGVLGENLRGVFDLFNITPEANHIKMGTLGKALGSYGAYILCSNHIAEFLQNRAKAMIYTTAPSLFDIALGYQGFLYLLRHKESIKKEIAKRQRIIAEGLGINMQGLICAYTLDAGCDALAVQERFIQKGFLVGAIRPPTVLKPILRLIPRLGESAEALESLCNVIQKEKC
ncbi:aminotransferase class I/II-fold pyridoxal phosphate-dependent enzyme [Sulfurospirillum barnesii]|uniref:7-keto-8-aminopelargonate synthetase-like enzyme n=1 Tax=Sulfurospirillum barnesii (strain ATCC 700032 / DSM 10660 / SES-3) TaxID=760154 RepID=I3XYJ5_SULBS|nr:pyridoxal phosphate-dependent aminotransferase family protein [Sulfurospirillum barnesii]AFL69019.1 7-keto-8-aminopelargonate synthetase-like enzyme [Sulfurospirillum barnesii SES-3]